MPVSAALLNGVNNIMDVSRILYEYIVQQYGTVVAFADKSGIAPIDLNAILLKDNVSEEIRIGLNLFKVLNIDADEFVFNHQIKELKNDKNARGSKKPTKTEIAAEAAAKSEIYNKCMRLSEIEKKKVLEYIQSIAPDSDIPDDEN